MPQTLMKNMPKFRVGYKTLDHEYKEVGVHIYLELR